MRTLKLILSGWQSVGLVVFFMLFFNMEVSGKGKITKNAPVFAQMTDDIVRMPVHQHTCKEKQTARNKPCGSEPAGMIHSLG